MPCEIETACEFEAGDEIILYWTRGTIDPAEFIAEMASEYDIDVTADQVQHCHMRFVPASTDPMDHMGMIFQFPTKPGRGAFPVTIYEPWRYFPAGREARPEATHCEHPDVRAQT